jgi:hypothetical protein
MILYFIPIWYLTYILYDDCILNIFENTQGKNEDETNIVYEWIKKHLFKFSYIHPLEPYGVLIITYIFSVYSLKLSEISK